MAEDRAGSGSASSADDILFGDQPRSARGTAIKDSDGREIYLIEGQLTEADEDLLLVSGADDFLPAQVKAYTRRPSPSLQVALDSDELHRVAGPALILTEIESGEPRLEMFYRDGQPSRPGGPNLHTYLTPGTLTSEENLNADGAHHREDGPALIFYRNGNVLFEEWWLEDQLHRVGGPASVEYDEDGKIIREAWYLNGKEHRDDGPAHVVTSDHPLAKVAVGNQEFELFGPGESWIREGRPDRDGGPAITAHDDEDQQVQLWFKAGKLHNRDGPAVVIRGPEGDLRQERYWLDGEHLSEETWKEKVSDV